MKLQAENDELKTTVVKLQAENDELKSFEIHERYSVAPLLKEIELKNALIDLEQNRRRVCEELYDSVQERYAGLLKNFNDLEAKSKALEQDINIAGDLFVDQVQYTSPKRRDFLFVCRGQLPAWESYPWSFVSRIQMATVVDDFHFCRIVYHANADLKQVNITLQTIRKLENLKAGKRVCIGIVSRKVNDPRNLWIQEELRLRVTTRVFVPPEGAAAGGAAAVVAAAGGAAAVVAAARAEAAGGANAAV